MNTFIQARRIDLALALTAVVAACVAPCGAGAVSPANLAPDLDEQAIRDVVAQQVEAWNHHDAPAWSAAFAVDGEFTSAQGATTRGREAIAALQSALFAGALRESYLRSDEVDVRLLGREVAIVEAASTLAGVPFPVPYGPSRGRYRSLVVLQKDSGRWNVVAMQCVRIGNQ